MADAPPSPQSHLSSNVAKCLSPPGDPAIGENCSSQGGHHDKDDNAMLHDTRQADPNGEENVREKIVNILRDWALWERSLEEVAERNGEARIIKHAADHGASPSAYVAPDATEHNVSSALGSSQDCPGTPFTTRSEDVAHDMTLGPNDGLHGGENVKLLRRPKQRQGIGDEGDELGEHELVSASQDCRSPSTILEGSLVREDAETSSALHPAQASSTGKAALRSPDQKRKPRRVLRSNTVEASPVWRREHNGLLRHRTDISRGKEGIPNNLEGIVSGWETTMNRPHQTAPMTRSHPAARVQRCRSERPSAWARSPSRGDIGGVLVKRGFYYGSGGNASLHRSSSRGPIDVARANSCPRRIGCNANRKRGRDEARQSGFWCEVRDGSNSGTEARRTLEAPSGSLADVAIVTRGGNRASRPRTTSRSDKARRKYDSPSHGSQDAVEAKKGGTSETVGVVSFDEQLRFTPLSQGAWLVDAASTRHVTHGTKGTSCKHHPQDLKEETGRRRRCCAATKGEGDEERGDVAGAQTDQGASENETRNCIAKDIGAGDNDARRMYDVILAKLRGEIDHLTREKIILHAAEDARRALARVRDLGASLGNPSAGKKEGSGSAEKQSNVRDVIDYDRVEATLSLIELATRAAGPDAGKQMLRALEDLDKIDQQSGMEEVKGTGQKGSAASIPAASRDPRWQAQEDAPEASMDGPPSMAISGRSQDTATVSGVLQAIGGWFQRDGKAKLQRANALESAEGFHGASGGEDIPREHLHHADRQRRVADPKEEDSADEATPRLRSSAGNQVRGDEEDEDQRHMAVGLWVPKVGERTPPEENICGIEVALGIDRSVNAQENEKLVYPGASVCEAVAEQPDGINSSSLEEFYLAWDGTGGDKRGDGPTIAKACVSATATDFPGVCSASSVEPPARTARETGNEQLGSSAPRRESLRQQSFSRNSRRGSGGGGHRLKKKYEIECSRGARGTGQELTSSVRGVQPTTRPSKGPAGRDSRRPASARSNITRQGQAAATRERSLMDAKRRPTTAPSKIETGSSRNMYARVERARVVPRGVCSGKRLCPKFDCGGAVPGSSSREGLVRRSPLIDAFHPALIRRRVSDPQGQRGCGPTVAPSASQGIERTSISVVTEASLDSGKLEGRADGANRDRVKRGSVLPLAVPPLATLPSPRPLLCSHSFAMGSRSTEDVDHVVDGNRQDISSSRSGNLTVLQWECVETWVEQRRLYLGPSVSGCLSSGAAFLRLRECLKNAVCSEGQGHANGEDPPGPGAARGSDSPCFIPGCLKLRAGEADLKRCASRGAPVGNGSRLSCELARGSWGDRLSYKTALVLEVTLWMLAPERERLVTWTVPHEDEAGKRADKEKSHRGGSWGGGKGGEVFLAANDNGMHHSMSAEGKEMGHASLGISLARARRHIKACPLVDGVFVLEADLDVAIRRWEESCLSRGAFASGDPKESMSYSSLESLVGGFSRRTGSPLRWPSSTRALVSGVREGSREQLCTRRGRRSQPRPSLCEAIGCSEGARYGDILPSAKARFCRRHRADGMIDISGLRCERRGCCRLAINGGKHYEDRALCAMHKREGRLDLEGLAFVVLLLARTRRGRIRAEGAWVTRQVKTARRSSNVRGGTAGWAYGTPISASVVGDVLLALTGQPLGSHSREPPEPSPRQIRACDPVGYGTGAVIMSIFNSESRNIPTPRSAHPRAALQSPSQQAKAQAAPSTDKGMTQVHQKKAGDSVDESEQLDGNVLIRLGRTHEQFGELKPDATGKAEKPDVPAVPDDEPQTSSLVHRNSSQERISGDAHGTLFYGSSSVLGNDCANDKVDISGRGQEGEHSRRGEDAVEAFPATGTAVDNFRVKAEDEHGGRVYVNKGAACVVSREGCKRGRAPNRSLPCGTREASQTSLALEASQVLTKNKRQLEAIFNSFAGSTGSTREMLLPDVLYFCDMFELRPGLISTGEILEAYKKVVFPGEIHVTDEEIGYRQPQPRPRPQPQLGRSRRSRRARSTPPTRSSRLCHEDDSAEIKTVSGVGSTWSLSADEGTDRRPRSRESRISSDWSRNRGADKRNVYIGRDQRFPLRQLRHVEFQSASSGKVHGAKAVSGGGNQFNAGSTDFTQPSTVISEDLAVESGARDSKLGPGLSQLQFMEWLDELAIGHSNLSGTSRKTSRLSQIPVGARAIIKQVPAKHGSRTTNGTELATKNSKALTLLQWMELSYGMKMFRIPAFCLRYNS